MADKDGSGGDLASASDAATLEKLGWVREAAGERFNHLELNVMIRWLSIGDNPKGAAEEMASNANRPGLTEELLLETPNALIGTVEGIVETLEMRRERYSISYVVVLEDEMEAFAPVVARLSGR